MPFILSSGPDPGWTSSSYSKCVRRLTYMQTKATKILLPSLQFTGPLLCSYYFTFLSSASKNLLTHIC